MKYLCWHGGKYCSSVATPKITTHYTVHPRETDPRWKGMFKIKCNFNSTSADNKQYVCKQNLKKNPLKHVHFCLLIHLYLPVCYTETKTCEKVNVKPRKKVEL